MSIFSGLRISASALTAERLRMDVISNNVANSQTTRTAAGGPYQRHRVVFSDMAAPGLNQAGGGVQVSQIDVDNRPGNVVNDPTHPDADAQGNVTYPNVDIATEMVDMISATRAYEANVVALQTAKEMLVKTLEIAQA
jgi:flagellar basal-body rod protein FlgC